MFAFTVQSVKASSGIYIRADGSVDPSTASITTVDNVTYTFTSNIYDSIVIQRNNIILDGESYTVQGSGIGNGFDCSGVSNVTIKNTNIENFQYGIGLGSSSHITLSNNKITNNGDFGIWLEASSNNTLSGNNINDNGYATHPLIFQPAPRMNWGGIVLNYSPNNTISENSIVSNPYGISLNSSSSNTISANNITTNDSYGVWLGSSSNNFFYNNNVIGNVVQVYSDASSFNAFDNGYPSGGNYWSDYSGVDQKSGPYQNVTGSDGIGDTPIYGDRYPLIKPYQGPIRNLNTGESYATIQATINAANNGDTIFVRNGLYYEHVVVNKTLNLRGEDRNYTIIDGNNTGNVVTLVSNNANVSGFTFEYSGDFPYSCIRLDQVSGCSIFSNNVNNNNSGDGIFLQSSERNSISDNLVINTWDGITFWGSPDNTVSGNRVMNPFVQGGTSIQFCYGSPSNRVIGNTFLGIAQIGIRCYASDSGSNVFIGNIVENYWHGIYADGSSNNIFYHNSIINNTITQAYLLYNVNVWDNGYPPSGNYWSDYTGIDANGDGIGDSPYVIDASNQDNYPLMNPWVSPNIAVTNVTVSRPMNPPYVVQVYHPIIGRGYDLNVNVTVTNQGAKIEGFNVTVFANASVIGTQYVLLNPGASINVTFSWDNQGFAAGRYIIKVYAAPVEGETIISDNTFIWGTITLTVPGDVNGDFLVDISDASLIGLHWQQHIPPAPVNVDINGDDIIDISDAAILGIDWQKHV